MPFVFIGEENCWAYLPEHSRKVQDIRATRQLHDLIEDDHSHLFVGTRWCPHHMFSSYDPFQPIPVDFVRNPHADCYRPIRNDGGFRVNGDLNLFDAVVQAEPPNNAEYSCPPDVIITDIKKKPLFMPYDSLQEIRLRLNSSVIKYNDRLICVLGILEGRNPRFNLQYKLEPNEEVRLGPYIEEAVDLSPLPARYALNQNGHKNANWLYRCPIRGVYQQGASHKNTKIRRSGDGSHTYIQNEGLIIRSYEAPNNILPLEDAFKRVKGARTGIPLSDDIALFWYNEKWGLEYRGTKLTDIEESDVSNGCLKLPETLAVSSIMVNKFAEVGVKFV